MGALAGLTGLLSGPAKWLLIVAAFFAWTAYQRHDAAVKARAECQAAQIQATLDETIRQRDIAEAAVRLAQERADAAAIELQEMADENARIKASLGAAGDGACRIPRDATKRLRNIK